MEKQPFISIVMPVYNAAKYLNNIFEDVLNQSYDNWELIAVNDCSKDESGKICDAFSKKDERIRVLHLEKNAGAGNARNQGINLAKGQYVTFVDADDDIELDLYKKAYEVLEKHPVDVVGWGVVEEYFDKKDKLVSRNEIVFPTTYCANKEEVQNTVLLLEQKTLLGYQWNKVYKRELLMHYNIRFESAVLYEDYFFNLEVMKHAQSLYMLKEALYYYKKRVNDSITTRFVPEYFELSHRRVKTMYDLCEKWEVDEKLSTTILGTIYMRYILSALMRNSDRRSKMCFCDQKEWIKHVVEDNLYSKLAYSDVKDKKLQLVQRLLNEGRYGTCVIIGKTICMIKQVGPVFFSLIKRNK